MEELVMKIRACMYYIGFTAILVSICVNGMAAPQDYTADTETQDETTNECWPCDWVPHPHIPGTGPSGPGEPEMA